MSYSICLDCRSMVSSYEKYCFKCEKTKKQNDKDFWKNHGPEYLTDPLRTKELEKDEIKLGE